MPHHRDTSPQPPITAREFSFITPKHFPDRLTYGYLCGVALIEATPAGWGLIHVTNSTGRKFTAITSDVAYVQMIADAPSSTLAETELPSEKFEVVQLGWPDDWARPISQSRRARRS